MSNSMLKSEIKLRKSFDSLEEEAFLNIMRTHGILSGSLAMLLKDKGLTQPQYNILRILRGAGNPGLPCLEIADRMVTREPDITRLLDRLEKSQRIQRVRSEKDRRVVMVKITAKGLSLLKRLDQPVREVHKINLGHMTQDELKLTNRLMTKARQSLPTG